MQKDLRFGKENRRRNWEWVPAVLIWALQIVIVCVLAFSFVWYYGQKVSMIGDSMNPVLENGNIVLVDRLKYDASTPKRGDIIVYKTSDNPYFSIKRIIALPGETIQIADNVIYINDQVLEVKYEVTGVTEPRLASEKITLAGDEFFVMGDNRESSEDSRDSEIGNVKRSEIEGKAWFIISPAGQIGFIR